MEVNGYSLLEELSFNAPSETSRMMFSRPSATSFRNGSQLQPSKMGLVTESKVEEFSTMLEEDATVLVDHRLAEDIEDVNLQETRSISSPYQVSLREDRRSVTAGPPLFHMSSLTGTLRPKPVDNAVDANELSRVIQQESSRLSKIRITSPVVEMHIARIQSYIADIRMRLMPHQNSRVDRYLKKAELFVRNMNQLAMIIKSSNSCAEEAARLIWSCVETLLSSSLEAGALERLFGVLDEVTEIIKYFGHEQRRGSALIRVKFLATIVQFCVEIALCARYNANSSTLVFCELDKQFYRYVRLLYEYKFAFLAEIWDDRDGLDVMKIRRWLSGYDCTISDDYSRPLGGRIARHEITCEWVTPMMRSFYQGTDRLLLITGPPGCAKSFAMSGIVDYARSTIRQRGFKLLTFSVDPFAPLRRSNIHLVKNLLLQLLDQSIGDGVLLQALGDIYERVTTRHDLSGNECLWTVLEGTLKRQQDETLVIIDGIDQIEGGWTVATTIVAQFQALKQHRHNLRCILLGRPFDEHLPPGCPSPFFIPDYFQSDLERFMRASISRVFPSFSGHERQELVLRVIRRGICSYIEVQLLCSVLARETIFGQVCSLLTQIPLHFSGLISFICRDIYRHKEDIGSILSVLLTAQRPLQLEEVKKFASLGGENDNLGPGAYRKFICDHTGGLVDVSGSQVHFLSPDIRHTIIGLCNENEFFVDLKAAHEQMMIKCLRIISAALEGNSQQPLFQELLDDDVATFLRGKIAAQSCLEYAIRFYVVHYKNSGHSQSRLLAEDLRVAFPSSILLAIVERRWWERQYSMEECGNMLECALQLRRAAFSTHARCVLQNLIELAIVHQRVGRLPAAIGTYHQAWLLSTKLYSEYHSFSSRLAETFVILCGTQEGYGADFASEIEKVYLYLYNAKRQQAGEEFMKYGELLVELYTRLCRIKHACSIRRELFEILVKRYGALHQMTHHHMQAYITLLETVEDYGEISRVRNIIVEAAAKLSPWDPLRIRLTLEYVMSCEAHGAPGEGEHVLHILWRALLSASATRTDDAFDDAFTEVTLRFVGLLKLRKSYDELNEALLDFWRNGYGGSLRRRACPSDTVLVRLRNISELIVYFEQYPFALELLTLLRRWYVSSGRKNHPESVLIAILLSRCYHHVDRGSDAEEMLIALFALLFASDALNVMLLDICLQLTDIYQKTEQRHEAIQICRRTLSRFWPGVLERDECELPNEHCDKIVLIVFRLAMFCLGNGSIYEAEHHRRSLFRAYRSSESVDVLRLMELSEKICDFYESVGNFEEAIAVWRELQQLTVHLGRQSSIYVRICYHIVQLARRHGHVDSEQILHDLILGYGSGSEAFCEESIEAILDLIRWYEEHNQTEELRRWYYDLFIAFQSNGDKCGLKGDALFIHIERYIAILRIANDISLAIDVARKFHATCISLYGPRSVLVIRALFQSAGVLELQASHISEAIKAYEEVISFRGSEETVIQLTRRARARLVVLYSSGQGDPKRAEQIYLMIWKRVTSVHGYTCDEAFIALRRLIEFFVERRSINAAFNALESAVVDILKYEYDYSRLFVAAKQLCEFYLLIRCRSRALALLANLRLEFNRSKYGGRLADVDRQSLILILALEELLNGNRKPTLLTDILLDLITETSLFEKWARIKVYGDVQVYLAAGTQLVRFLERKHRTVETQQIKEELWILFADEVRAPTTRSGPWHDFFLICTTEMKHHAFEFFDTAVAFALSLSEKAHFEAFYDTASFVHEYVMKKDGWTKAGRAGIGFKLAVKLSSQRNSGLSSTLAMKMEKLSLLILAEILKSRTRLSLESLTQYQIHLVCVLLGRLCAWDSLECALELLWKSRAKTRWGYTIILSIGLRLCETRFRAKRVTEALELLADIRYNTAEALGPLHPSTLQCDHLLARLYTATREHVLAADVRIGVLRNVRGALDEGMAAYVYAGEHDTDLTALGLDYARQLRSSVQRQGREAWDQMEKEDVGELLDGIRSHISEGAEYWQEMNLDVLDTWAEENRFLPATNENGYWEAPTDWGFLESKVPGDDESLFLETELEDSDDVLALEIGGTSNEEVERAAYKLNDLAESASAKDQPPEDVLDHETFASIDEETLDSILRRDGSEPTEGLDGPNRITISSDGINGDSSMGSEKEDGSQVGDTTIFRRADEPGFDLPTKKFHLAVSGQLDLQESHFAVNFGDMLPTPSPSKIPLSFIDGVTEVSQASQESENMPTAMPAITPDGRFGT